MNYNIALTEMSARIDMYLEQERETEEFVSKRLYEYVREVLYESYRITRDEMEVHLGGGIAEIGLMITGLLLPNNEVISATTKLGDARISSQRDLDNKYEPKT